MATSPGPAFRATDGARDRVDREADWTPGRIPPPAPASSSVAFGGLKRTVDAVSAGVVFCLVCLYCLLCREPAGVRDSGKPTWDPDSCHRD